jgi:hypothetical protein
VVAHRIAADIAGLVIRDIIAIDAKFDVGAHTAHCFAEMSDFSPILPEQMKDEAQRGFFPYARQFLELCHCIRYQFR